MKSLIAMTFLAFSFVEKALYSTQFIVFCVLAGVGLAYIMVTAIFGGDHDVHVEHEISVEHDSAPSFLSPRVFCSFLVGFGATGAGCTAYGANSLIASMAGLLPGLGSAVIAYLLGYVLYRQQADSSMKRGEVVGKTGTVVTRIPENGIGEINVNVAGRVCGFTAMAENQTEILPGRAIRVTKDLGDRVQVRQIS